MADFKTKDEIDDAEARRLTDVVMKELLPAILKVLNGRSSRVGMVALNAASRHIINQQTSYDAMISLAQLYNADAVEALAIVKETAAKNSKVTRH